MIHKVPPSVCERYKGASLIERENEQGRDALVSDDRD
jgi:hypothetical protein